MSMDLDEYDDAYATCEETRAVLRINPGDISPREITEALGIEPTEINERGKVRVSLTTGRTREVRRNAWFLSSEGHLDSKDLRRHLDWLVDRIEPAAAALTRLRKERGVRADIWCVWWSAAGSGGPTLSPKQMRRIAPLDLDCAFEIMFFGRDD
jgi:hypothetical protein